MAKVVVTTYVDMGPDGDGPWIRDHSIEGEQLAVTWDDSFRFVEVVADGKAHQFAREYVVKVVPAGDDD